ncbi:MAG: efflux RND transporter permease subunit, partial [Gemmatimonadota bacterium]|nr:efflux RND transporter permease subunit [Gemmatimonadota bacterium]
MIRLSIRRPVAVAMTYLAVALLGLAAWRNIPIELLPEADLPRLTVRADWPGASPETVEAFLTSPLEATIQLVRGVEKVTSISEERRATIEVEFSRETDMDFARLDLSERLSTVEENELPPGVGQVVVEPYVPPEFEEQNRGGFLTYTFTGSRTLEALREHLEEYVVPELSRIEGVAVVRAYGGRDRVVEVELDREQMAALGVTASQVRDRISSLDLVREAGTVREGEREWTVTILNRAQSTQDVLQTIVSEDGGRIVRVSDVAVVRDTYEEVQTHYRVNGRPAVQMLLTKEIGANTVRVADRVKERIRQLASGLPPNTRFILDQDESEEIRRQLTDLRSRAAVAGVVIFVVLMGFLGSVRSAAVVFTTIVFSILISLNLIYFMGLSLNLLTLMGLAMGFGLIVDNSIVVLENVYRKWQSGVAPKLAALEGTREVVLPIMAATATTLIVFVPFVYLQDELRVYYVPLAVVVALTLMASLFVAFSFIPALAGRVLGRDDHAGPGFGGGNSPTPSGTGVGDGPGASGGPALRPRTRRPMYERFYAGLVSRTLAWPWVAVVLATLALGGSYYLFDRYVTRGTLWGAGWGQQTYISIQIRLPRGSDLDRTDQLAAYFEDRLRTIPEVEQFVSQVRQDAAQIMVTFPDHLENTQVPVAIKDRLFAYSLGFSGAEVRVFGYGPSFYGGGGGAPNYSIQVLGYNYEEVRDIAENIGARLSRISRVRDVNTNATGGFFQRERASEFVVDVHRDAL